jgi:hypothetical protein
MVTLTRSADGAAETSTRIHADARDALGELAEAGGVSRPYFLRRLIADYGALALADLLRPGRIAPTEVSHAPAGESPAESITEPGGVAARRPAGQKRGRR